MEVPKSGAAETQLYTEVEEEDGGGVAMQADGEQNKSDAMEVPSHVNNGAVETQNYSDSEENEGEDEDQPVSFQNSIAAAQMALAGLGSSAEGDGLQHSITCERASAEKNEEEDADKEEGNQVEAAILALTERGESLGCGVEESTIREQTGEMDSGDVDSECKSVDEREDGCDEKKGAGQTSNMNLQAVSVSDAPKKQSHEAFTGSSGFCEGAPAVKENTAGKEEAAGECGAPDAAVPVPGAVSSSDHDKGTMCAEEKESIDEAMAASPMAKAAEQQASDAAQRGENGSMQDEQAEVSADYALSITTSSASAMEVGKKNEQTAVESEVPAIAAQIGDFQERADTASDRAADGSSFKSAAADDVAAPCVAEAKGQHASDAAQDDEVSSMQDEHAAVAAEKPSSAMEVEEALQQKTGLDTAMEDTHNSAGKEQAAVKCEAPAAAAHAQAASTDLKASSSGNPAILIVGEGASTTQSVKKAPRRDPCLGGFSNPGSSMLPQGSSRREASQCQRSQEGKQDQAQDTAAGLDVAVVKANKTHRLQKRLVSFSGAAADPDSKAPGQQVPQDEHDAEQEAFERAVDDDGPESQFTQIGESQFPLEETQSDSDAEADAEGDVDTVGDGGAGGEDAGEATKAPLVPVLAHGKLQSRSCSLTSTDGARAVPAPTLPSKRVPAAEEEEAG